VNIYKVLHYGILSSPTFRGQIFPNSSWS